MLDNPASIAATPTVNAPGSGYAVGDVLTITQPGSSWTATVTVNSVTASGGVAGISLSQNGAMYSTATAVPTTGGKGTGCTLNIVGTPNGIDYLEVADTTTLPQQTLLVYCLKGAPSNLTPDNVMITGGESITGITASSVAVGSAPNVLVVQTSRPGDFSTYTLRLVNSAIQAAANPSAFDLTQVLAGFDPQLAEVDFSFKVECGPNFDCGPQPSNCPPDLPTAPAINYLAKDYGSFRTLMLDRLNQLLPGWGATSEADLGVALAELIAYRADLLSYQQDAIATEAYIETARSRVSLRRHALLVDYHVHDGCNARAWIHINVAGNTGDQIFMDRTLTRFYTYAPGMPSTLAVGSGNEEAALAAGVQVFEPMQDAILYPEHNQMNFYTWSDLNCCLPEGATEATLAGPYPNLQPGDVLIFEEVIGPQTGNAADADLRHRCAVRLTQAATQDANGNPLVDPLFDNTGHRITGSGQTPMVVTEIQWSQADALPFPICLSSTYLDPSDNIPKTVVNVSVALGNVVLADHGLSLADRKFAQPTVPPPTIFYPPDPGADPCQPPKAPLAVPARYRPVVPDAPLTQAVPLPLTGGPETPGVVLLGGTSQVNLNDTNGLLSLTVQATNPANWPPLFGVFVKQNQSTPTNFDLSIHYNPPKSATGVVGSPTVEHFINLSFKTSDPNFVATVLKSSNLIQVPSNYVPPATAPSGYPGTITMLPSSGPVSLQDTSNPPATFLTLQATNPQSWPKFIGVLAEAPSGQPAAACCAVVRPQFNLLVVYNPLSGGEGVTLPVTLEQLTPPAQPTLVGEFNPGSSLVSIRTFAQAPDQSLSAYELMNFDPAESVPAICLCGTFEGVTTQWVPRQDLLESSESDQAFVVEIESDGTAALRFATPADPGSSETNGMVPSPGTTFVANYRIGNGAAGNVGAESLIYLAAADARIQSCTNPLPASGGVDPETNDQIRRRAPAAFLSQERAVTMADYESVAAQNPQVDQAVASLRWTGSWYSAFIAVEPKGGGNLSPALQQTLRENAELYRLAGQDIKLESPQYVSLAITLQVQVDCDYFQADVEQSLLQVLGNKMLPSGQKGLFFPDNFTFGQTVYLSPVYAAARSVPGVLTVTATQFQPQGVNSTQFLATGAIRLGAFQIARLDNDPSFPDHGQSTLIMQGGK